MTDVFEDFLELHRHLHHDVDRCVATLNLLEAEVEQNLAEILFWRRTLIRATFAYIEGMTYRVKQIVLDGYESGYLVLTQPQIAILSEVNYVLQENGEVAETPAKIRIASSIRFMFKIMSKMPPFKEHDLVLNDGGWEAFKTGLKIRDRLMHPKDLTSVLISEAEIDTIGRARVWFLENLSAIIGQGPSALSS
jgi:hypothetical protein